jgi:putative FmdB family regulatory protein
VPTYQYACTECGDRLEVVQKFSDDSLTVCPACSGRLRKVFSAVGIVFKGSGFYRNDSRKGSEVKAKAVNGNEPGSAKDGKSAAAASGNGSGGSGSDSGSSSGDKSSGDKSSGDKAGTGSSSSSGSAGSSGSSGSGTSGSTSASSASSGSKVA